MSAGALAAAGPQPASFALVAGAITWLARTGRRELAPPAAGANPRLVRFSQKPGRASLRDGRRW